MQMRMTEPNEQNSGSLVTVRRSNGKTEPHSFIQRALPCTKNVTFAYTVCCQELHSLKSEVEAMLLPSPPLSTVSVCALFHILRNSRQPGIIQAYLNT